MYNWLISMLSSFLAFVSIPYCDLLQSFKTVRKLTITQLPSQHVSDLLTPRELEETELQDLKCDGKKSFGKIIHLWNGF